MQEKSRERIIRLIKNENLTYYSFYKKTGLANGYLRVIRISDNSLSRINKVFPRWNIHWIITGLGSMYLSQNYLSDQQIRGSDLTNTKQNILRLIKHENITKYEFYKKTTLSNDYLKVKTISVQSLQKINKAFPHWNLHAIVTNIGELLIKPS